MESQAKISHSKSLKALRMPGHLEPLVEAAEQFGLNKRPTSIEINCFKELFYTLIFKADANTKKKLSMALSRSHYTPRTLAIFFTMEPVEIAASILMFSPVIGERDLNAILDKCPVSHMRVIARRSLLTVSTVKKMLSRNDNLDLTRKLLKKNSSLADNAGICDLLRMPPNKFSASHVVVETRTEKQEKPIPGDVEPKPEAPGLEKLLEIANRGGRISSRRQQLQGIYTESNAQVEKQLLDHARKGNHGEFANVVAGQCNLETAKTLEIIERQDAGKLACLFCAMQISKLVVSQLLLLINTNIGKDVSVFRAVTKEYSKLRISECQAIFENMGAQFTSGSVAQQEMKTTNDFIVALRERRGSLSHQNPSLETLTIPGTMLANG